MSCKLSAIVAVCDDWGIGRDGGMVVANKQDMRHFVSTTTGHPVIMGRKTLESFPGGRPLKNRLNIVLTRDPFFHREGVEVVHSVDAALDLVCDQDEAWVIGGARSTSSSCRIASAQWSPKTIAYARLTLIFPILTKMRPGSL